MDTATTDDHATTVPLNVSPTDQHTRNLQFLTSIGQMIDPTVSNIDAFQKLSQIVGAGINLKGVGTIVANRSTASTANYLVQRGASAEAAFGFITAFGFGTQNVTEIKARPVTGQTVPVVVVENQAGTQTKWNVDGAGATFQAGNATIQGVINAGSGAIAITLATGYLDASKISGVVPAANQPAYTGDVTIPVGSTVTTVALVGGKAATNVAAATTAVEARKSDGTPSVIAQYNASGGMTFTGPVVGTTFSGAFTGSLTGNISGNAATATNVAATGITGTVMASQIDVAIARDVDVPSNNGTGATGTWPIGISGNAATATVASGVVTSGVTNAMLAGSIDAHAKLLPYSVDQSLLGEGAVQAQTSPDMTVKINALTKYNTTGQYFNYPGTASFSLITPTDYRPASSGQFRHALLAINGSGVAYINPGPSTSSLATAGIPNADPNTTPLAIISLSYGQTAIQPGDILQARELVGDFTGGGAGQSGSIPGHIHGRDPEVRIQAIGMDEGFVSQTGTTPSKSVIIYPVHYRNTSGNIVQNAQQTFTPPWTQPTQYERIDGIYLNPANGQYGFVGGPANDPTIPYPAISGNYIPLAYLHVKVNSNAFYSAPQSIEAWIEDARAWLRSGGVQNVPVIVSDGGTGTTQFTQGFVYSTGASNGTAPLTTQPATSSSTQGLGFAPVLTGVSGGSTVEMLGVGGGTLSAGTTSLARLIGTHAILPAITAGTITDVVALQAELPTVGTNRIAAILGGPVRIGNTTVPAAGNMLDVAGTVHATGATALDGNVTILGKLGIGGAAGANTSLQVTAASVVTATTPVGAAFQSTLANTQASGVAYGVFASPTIDTSQATMAWAAAVVTGMAKGAGSNPIPIAYGVYSPQPTVGTNNVAIYGGGTIQADSATAAGANIYGSSNAPSMGLGNNALYGSRTTGLRFSLATAAGQFNGSSGVGDSFITAENGRLLLSANASVATVSGMTQLVLQNNGSVSIGGVNNFPTLPAAMYDMAIYRPDVHQFYYFNGSAFAPIGVETAGMYTVAPVVNFGPQGSLVDLPSGSFVVNSMTGPACYFEVEGWVRFDQPSPAPGTIALDVRIDAQPVMGNLYPTGSCERFGAFCTLPFAGRIAVSGGAHTVHIMGQTIEGNVVRITYILCKWRFTK